MLLGLKQPLNAGDKFPVTLLFKRAGACQAHVWVEEGFVEEINLARKVSTGPR